MLDEKKILVIEENEQQRQNLNVIFEFIGENTLCCDYAQWQASPGCGQFSAQEVGMFVLGDNAGQWKLEHMLQEIHKYYGVVPVMLMPGFEDLGEDWDPYLKHMVVARLVVKPNYNSLMDALYRAQRLQEARRDQDSKRVGGRPTHLFRSLVGTSRDIQQVRSMMAQVAEKDVTVLIVGESGTGKEVVARNLHYHSTRRDGPFVPVNCGAIPAELLESELFGHEKGAFTGAISARAGRFEMAEGGTLFLDEIGDMPLHMQVKILRVLQEKNYERVGGNKSFKTDVRIIAATHRNLEEMIAEGNFREDLYYRLNVFPIDMPSLRNRSEDIPLLINELVSRLESEKRGSIRFNSGAVMSLCQHPWPGNVRELANLVERMAIMHPFGVAGVQDLPSKYRHVDVEEDDLQEADLGPQTPNVVSVSDVALLPESGIDLKEYITNLEQSLIQQALDNTGGVVARAADQLMIRRTTLVEKMRKYGMNRA